MIFNHSEKSVIYILILWCGVLCKHIMLAVLNDFIECLRGVHKHTNTCLSFYLFSHRVYTDPPTPGHDAVQPSDGSGGAGSPAYPGCIGPSAPPCGDAAPAVRDGTALPAWAGAPGDGDAPPAWAGASACGDDPGSHGGGVFARRLAKNRSRDGVQDTPRDGGPDGAVQRRPRGRANRSAGRELDCIGGSLRCVRSEHPYFHHPQPPARTHR